MSDQKLTTFQDFGLFSWILDRCSALGLEYPTLVQKYCIPEILKGKDCIGESQTGTGKTLAFALPILQVLADDPYGIFALVLTPTRELAFQIAQQFRALGEPMMLKVALIVGGIDRLQQAQELTSRPHIVVATPGRLLDHLKNSSSHLLKKIKFLVLDEADRLLDGHFVQQIDSIFDFLPKSRQTLIFSATMTDTLEELKKISPNAFVWNSNNQEEVSVTVEKLEQKYIISAVAMKDAHLVQVINQFQERCPGRSIMVFTDTCKTCQLLSVALNNLGFRNTTLNSSLSQKERFASLNKFKSGLCKLLLATDVASRGLDIPTVDLVINHNVPSIAKDYVHRVGRTARAGRGGSAVTLLTPHDIRRLHAIEDLIKTKLVNYKPAEKKVLTILTQVNVAVREAEIILGEQDFGEKKRIYKRKKQILQGLDPDDDDEETKSFHTEKNKKMKTNLNRTSKKKKNKVNQHTDSIV